MPQFKKITRDYYNQEYFGQHHDYYYLHPSRFQKYRIRNVMRLAQLAPGENVIDMGVGWGTFTFLAAKLAEKVIGIDFSFHALSECRRLFNPTGMQNVLLTCADVQDVPLPEATFDLIICADLIEHLYPDQYLDWVRECNRLLKHGGRLVVWAPNQGHWLEKLRKHRIFLDPCEGHVDYKDLIRVENDLTAHGFRVVEALYVESHLPLIRLVEKLLMPVIPLFRRRILLLAYKK